LTFVSQDVLRPWLSTKFGVYDCPSPGQSHGYVSAGAGKWLFVALYGGARELVFIKDYWDPVHTRTQDKGNKRAQERMRTKNPWMIGQIIRKWKKTGKNTLFA
jgi:hypothetical protein